MTHSERFERLGIQPPKGIANVLILLFIFLGRKSVHFHFQHHLVGFPATIVWGNSFNRPYFSDCSRGKHIVRFHTRSEVAELRLSCLPHNSLAYNHTIRGSPNFCFNPMVHMACFIPLIYFPKPFCAFHFISFNIFKEGHPSAMKLISKGPST